MAEDSMVEYMRLELMTMTLASEEGIHAQCMFKYSSPPAGFVPAEGVRFLFWCSRCSCQSGHSFSPGSSSACIARSSP